jgi:hypothetical protein
MLRLPTGIFYARGVKADVVFFDRKPASPNPWSRRLWVYDLRTNMHFHAEDQPDDRSQTGFCSTKPSAPSKFPLSHPNKIYSSTYAKPSITINFKGHFY